MNNYWMSLAGLALVGCVTPQTVPQTVVVPERQFTLGNVQKEIRPGMSPGDVAAALGSPNIVSRDSSGKESWIYDKAASEVRVENSGIAGGIIIFGGYKDSSSTTSSQKTLTVIIRFSDKGVVESTSYHASRF